MPETVELTPRERATIRAALRFWRDEMGPHGVESMRPYFDRRDEEPLTTVELDRLIGRLSGPEDGPDE